MPNCTIDDARLYVGTLTTSPTHSAARSQVEKVRPWEVVGAKSWLNKLASGLAGWRGSIGSLNIPIADAATARAGGRTGG